MEVLIGPSGPLREYNTLFRRFQARVSMTSLVDQVAAYTTSSHTPPPLSQPTKSPVTPGASHVGNVLHAGPDSQPLEDNFESSESENEAEEGAESEVGPLLDEDFGHREVLFTLEEGKDIEFGDEYYLE